jgi:hypothetical protein
MRRRNGWRSWGAARMEFPRFLIPETALAKSGETEAFPMPSARLLLTLDIRSIREQQSLDLWIEGSADGAAWGELPLCAFPQKFYAGASAIVLNPALTPEITAFRARWKTNRWGRGDLRAEFTAYLFAEIIPAPR